MECFNKPQDWMLLLLFNILRKCHHKQSFPKLHLCAASSLCLTVYRDSTTWCICFTHLLLRSIGGRAVLLRRQRLKQESSAVSGRQRIPLWYRSQLLEDGVRLAEEWTSLHLEEINKADILDCPCKDRQSQTDSITDNSWCNELFWFNI